MTQVRKGQVIKQLESMNYERIHTLHKGWMPVNSIMRRGWFIATPHFWKYLGDTLDHAMERLELEEDCYGQDHSY